MSYQQHRKGAMIMSESPIEPMVSIIVPVYNTEKYICKCLDSILSQTYKNFELIIIDDGSSDSSPQICDAYANKDARIVVIHQKNQGVSVARNIGLALSHGNILFFIDSDDYASSYLVENVIAAFQSSNYDMILFNAKSVQQASDKVPATANAGYKLKPIDIRFAQRSAVMGNFATLWSFASKRKLWNNLRFDVSMTSAGEDGWMIINLLGQDISIGSINSSLYFHRVDNRSSLSHLHNSRTYFNSYMVWLKRLELSKKLCFGLDPYCTGRILSSIVKAYCMNMLDHKLTESELKQLIQFLDLLSIKKVKGRYRDKMLCLCIQNHVNIALYLYSRYKTGKSKDKKYSL